MHSQLAFVVDLIASGAGARSIMCHHGVSSRKLERALNSVRLAKALELERRVLTAQMRFQAAKHLAGAIRGLAGLATDGTRPETQRKACMALIAAATGVNLSAPGVPVFPEDVIGTWGGLGGPEAQAAPAAPFANAPNGQVTFDDSDDVDANHEAEEFEPEYLEDDERPSYGPTDENGQPDLADNGAGVGENDSASGADQISKHGHPQTTRDDHSTRPAEHGHATAAWPCHPSDGGAEDGGRQTGIVDGEESGQKWPEVAESGRPVNTETSQPTQLPEVADWPPTADPAQRGVAPRAPEPARAGGHQGRHGRARLASTRAGA